MSGLYTNNARHCDNCAFCKPDDRGARKRKRDQLRESGDTLKALQDKQEPCVSWAKVKGKIYEHTGVHDATFDLVAWCGHVGSN